MFPRCVDCFSLMAANWVLAHTTHCSLLLLLCVYVCMRALTFALALSFAPTHQDKDWSATVQPLEPCANWINKVIFSINTTTHKLSSFTSPILRAHFALALLFSFTLVRLPSKIVSFLLLLCTVHILVLNQHNIQHTFHLRNEFASFAWR